MEGEDDKTARFAPAQKILPKMQGFSA